MTVIRWILAAIAGVVSYWVVMLLTLGIIAMVVKSVENVSEDRAGAIVGHSAPLLGLAFFLGSFAAALVAIAIVPRRQWRTMGAVAGLVAAGWAVYGQVYAAHDAMTAVIEAGGGIIGAVAAYGAAQGLFGRRAGS
jgi:hypothetical protein